MERYPFAEIEPKWQRRWEDEPLFRCPTDAENRFYCLMMFPYPSGDLHVGPRPQLHHRRRGRALQDDAGAQTCSRRWAGTPSACRPRTPPSSAASTPPRGRDANIAQDEGAVPQLGRRVRLGPGGRHLPPRLLPVDAVDLPEAVRAGASRTGRPRPSTGAPRARPCWPTSRWSNGQCERCETRGARNGPRAVVLQDHRRTPTGCSTTSDSWTSWPERVRTMQRQLDRPERGRRDRLQDPGDGETPAGASRRGVDTIYGVTFMVLAPEHPLAARRSSRAPARRGRGRWPSSERVKRQSAHATRATADVEKEGVFTGTTRHQPRQRRARAAVGGQLRRSWNTAPAR